MSGVGITAASPPERLFVKKSAQTTDVTGVLFDDPHLTLPLRGAVTYLIEAFLVMRSASLVPDFQFTFSHGGATTDFSAYDVIEAGIANTASSDNGLWTDLFVVPIITINTDYVIRVSGILALTAAGDFKLRWAQNTTDATLTALKIESWLHAREAR